MLFNHADAAAHFMRRKGDADENLDQKGQIMGKQYTIEEKVQAIKLYEETGHVTYVINELGYPSRTMLYYWLEEYSNSRQFNIRMRKPKYSQTQRKQAVDYYLNNGRSITKTTKDLGYPGKTLLREWINEDVPKEMILKCCNYNKRIVRYSQEQKTEIVQKYTAGESPKELSLEYYIHPNTVRSWAKKLLGQEIIDSMSKTQKQDNSSSQITLTVDELITEKEQLEQTIYKLKHDIYHLQLQKDVLEKAAELIKKEKGVNPITLTNREKTVVIDALRCKYKLTELLSALQIAKSSYCYQENVITSEDKYALLRERIKEIFLSSDKRYGYRRIHISLRNEGTIVSEKIVRRIMQEEKLIVPFIKIKKYSSYLGEISPPAEDLVKRNFHSEKPNTLWLTDITEFHIPAGKVYLSPMIDCFDGLPVAWTIGTSPNAELANSMLDAATSTLSEEEHPIVHTDRGCHYRWPGWLERMRKAKLTRSMSKKGCSPDNAACEGFHGRLKNEFFYNKSWRNISIDSFISLLDKYIRWYCEKRIKVSLGGMSPIEYRRNLGLLSNHKEALL